MSNQVTSQSQSQVSLFDVITLDGRQYITTQRLYADKKASGMESYISITEFNRAVKSLTTYNEMLALGHIIYAEYSQVADIGRDAGLAPLLISNSYNPLILIDPTAQQTIEQHLDDEASKISSLGANSLSAAVKTGDTASMNTAQQALGAQGVQNPLMAIAGFMTSEGLELLLASVREKEAAQRDAQLAQAQLAIAAAEKDRALAQASINLTAALGAAAEVAHITAKDALWVSFTFGFKMLGLKPKKVMAFLREKGYLNKDNAPTSRLLKATVEVARSVAVVTKEGKTFSQTKISPEGLLWLIKNVEFPEELRERHCRLDWSEETLTAFFQDTLANTNDEEV